MGVVALIRQGVLVSTTLFSLIVLGINAYFISETQRYFHNTATFCALGLAVAVISLVTLPVILVVDFVRRGAYTSMIVVELAWLSILWILWVATAGETLYEYNLVFPVGCVYNNAFDNTICQETQAIVAFSFLNFIINLIYTVFLLVMAIVAANRGDSVWLSSVKESFGSPTGAVQHPMTQYNASPLQVSQKHAVTPVQPQHTGTQPYPSTTPVASV